MRAKRLASLLCSLMFAARLSWALTHSSEAVQAFNVGVRYFNERNFNAAIPHFDEAISRDSNFMEAIYARGASKYYLRAEQSALTDLSRVLEMQPDHIDARALRGAIHYETDRWDEALRDFNDVLSRRSRDAQSLLGRGVIRLKRQELTGAARDFRMFLRVRPDDPLAPDIRKILASINGGTVKTEEPESASAPEAPRQTMEDLTVRLRARPITDTYQQKVLRGESTTAIGDIEGVPPTPAPHGRPQEHGVIIPDSR